MYESDGVKEIAPDVFEVSGSGTVEYKVKFFRNTGTWRGFIAETDNGTKIHVPDGHVDEFASKLVKASHKKIDEYVKGPGGTRVTGEDGGVRLNDTQDETKISDNEAQRLALEADKYIRNRDA
jgi:hypothetical protein